MNKVEIRLAVKNALWSGRDAGQILSFLLRGARIFDDTKFCEKKAISLLRSCIKDSIESGHRVSLGSCQEPGNMAPEKYWDSYGDNFDFLLNQREYLGFRVSSVGTGTGRYNYIPEQKGKEKNYKEWNRVHRFLIKRNCEKKII